MAHVFIAYKREDRAFAYDLQKRLEDAEIPTWMDESIPEGRRWREEIDDNLKNAFSVIVVITPESVNSIYVQYEWMYALGREIEVIPILFRKADLPYRLEEIQYIDFSHEFQWDRLINKLEGIRLKFDNNEYDKHLLSLIHALEIDDVNTQYAAASELMDLRDEESIPYLEALLQYHNSWTRKYACKILGIFRQDTVVPQLMRVLRNDPDFQVREQAAESLGNIANDLAIQELINALNDDTKPVQNAAIKALANMKAHSTTSEIRRMLYRGDSTCGIAAQALGDLKDQDSVQAIRDICLNHEDETIRAKGARAIGQIGTPNAVLAVNNLIELLEDDTVWLRSDDSTVLLRVCDEVEKTLRKIGTPEALAAVEEWEKRQSKD